MKSEKKTSKTTPIRLRDVGLQFKPKKKPDRTITIKIIPQGIEITIPTYEGFRIEDRTGVKVGNLSRIKSVFSWIFLTIILPMMMYWLNEKPENKVRFFVIYGGILIILWGIFLYQFLKTDKIVLSRERMSISDTVCGLTFRQTEYDIRSIKNFRLGYTHDSLCFDYKGQTITWGDEIDKEEATHLIHQLSDILTFRCHSVERIIFGGSQYPDSDPYTTLQNPGVSILNVPFVHLKQIIIHTETYDFHQVEQFITYAVNVIGQGYLKKHVEVHLYGNPEKLHTNLRNNFVNLCKQVHVHQTENC